MVALWPVFHRPDVSCRTFPTPFYWPASPLPAVPPHKPRRKTIRMRGWRMSAVQSRWIGSRRAMPRRRRTSPAARRSKHWKRRSAPAWIPPPRFRVSKKSVRITTTSGRTRSTSAACGDAPRWRNTASRNRRGKPCWIWTRSMPPKARNGSGTGPIVCARSTSVA